MNPVSKSIRFYCALLMTAAFTGCARYEFDVIQPADQRQHVGRKTDAVVKIEPLVYRLRSVEGRLVLRIRNETDAAIQLDGERSAVVDTEGQSHPLRSQTIASGSFIKLIIPPLRPRVGRPGPTFGVGVGIGTSRYDARRGHALPSHDPFLHEPMYMTVYDDSDAYYWDLEGEGAIRLELVYRRGEETINHHLELARRKMK